MEALRSDRLGARPGNGRLIPHVGPPTLNSALLSARLTTLQRRCAQHRTVLTVLLTAIVFGSLALVLAGRQAQFSAAFLSAPIWILAIAAVLQLVSLVTRSEAWNFCMRAAGGSAPRRVVFRAAGIGALASIASGQLGAAMRIGMLRRTAPRTSPRLPALVAAEVPIIAVEMTLAALFTFTLVGPLHLPIWIPILAVACMVATVAGLRVLAQRRRSGLWAGLAALRSLRGRERLVALVVLGVLAQIGRNLLVLHAVGVHATVLNAIAVLIVTVSLSALPMGPSVGATASVLILGSHGVAATVAGGLLLTVTGTAGALCYAAWAFGDQALATFRGKSRAAADAFAAEDRSAVRRAASDRRRFGLGHDGEPILAGLARPLTGAPLLAPVAQGAIHIPLIVSGPAGTGRGRRERSL